MAHSSSRTFLYDGESTKSIDHMIDLRYANYSDIFGTPGAKKGVIDRETGASTVAYVYRCVQLRAGAVSGMPWAIMEGDESVYVSGHHGVPDWMHDIGDLLWLTESSLSILGQGYWYPVYGRGRRAREIQEVKWFAPTTMKPHYSPITGNIEYYMRTVNGRTEVVRPEEVVHFKLLNYAHEQLPGQSPVGAALADASVMFNLNQFAAAFFGRGAIRATMLTVEGNPIKEERDRLKEWWARAFSSIGKAFGSEVFSAAVKPVMVGDGLESLTDKSLTAEKREAIATAMGIPHSLLLSNAANYATAAADIKNFHTDTVIPETNRIAARINRTVFRDTGQRFVFQPERLPTFQEDEEDRASSFSIYVGAGMPRSVAAQMLGLNLPEGVTYEDLDKAAEEQAIAEAELDAIGNRPPTDDDDFVKPSRTNRDQQDEHDSRTREESKFRKWLSKRKNPNLDAFKSDILTATDKLDLAIQYGKEDAVSEDAPFPAWGAESYP